MTPTPSGRNIAAFRHVAWQWTVTPCGKVFRIGHLGDFNDLMLMGTLSGVEMGLKLADIPHQSGGTATAMQYLSETAETGDSS